MEMGSTKCSVGKRLAHIPWNSRILNQERLHSYHHIMVSRHTIIARYPRFAHADLGSLKRYRMRQKSWKAFTMPVSLNGSSTVESEDYSSNEDNKSEDSQQESARPLSSDELKALLFDQERSKLVRKLSEANQQNRYLKRQLHTNEDSLVNFKSELALMKLEVQALVKLAEEISQLGIPEGSRKIKGKYIQSHLHLCLQAMHDKLKEQLKGVEAAQSKEIPLLWHGMAESVQVMGSFDGWSQGEHLSPEYDGSFTTFITTLMLRPGRYEIKFLVDGDWQLSPEYPEVGEGLTKNNLLIVE